MCAAPSVKVRLHVAQTGQGSMLDVYLTQDSAAGSPHHVRGVLDWHCLLAPVCGAAFREVACHDPAQHRSGLTLSCVRSFIHIGSQIASKQSQCV